MKKWYICTLVIAFTLLGYISKEQSALPNQKIVLQFSDISLTSNKIENTVAIVEKQLLELGVNNIQIHEIENGQLKITYYSDADVVSVKSKLSKGENLAIDYTSKNKGKKQPLNSDNFNLDVYKIQETSDTNSGFDGEVAIEPRLESDRYSNPNVYFSAYLVLESKTSIQTTVAYKVSANIAIAIDNISYKIPEVRAGPDTNKTS